MQERSTRRTAADDRGDFRRSRIRADRTDQGVGDLDGTRSVVR
jgi:hypothetical protein